MVRHALMLLPALGLAADHPSGVVVEAIKFEFDPIGEYCLVPYFGPADYSTLPRLEQSGTKSMKGCAQLCSADQQQKATAGLGEKGCASWTYLPDASGDYACYDITSLNPDAPGSVPLIYDNALTTKPITGLAGACNCPSKAATTLTGENFPADNTDKYKELFENSQHQPAPLACWPKDELGNLKLAPPVVQYSNQVAAGDPTYFSGWCTGLTKQAPFEPGKDCKTACQAEPSCTGFQWVPENSQRDPGCFWGAGYDCDNPDTFSGTTLAPADGSSASFDATADSEADMIAERYTRGYVTQVARIVKFRVIGLKKRFGDQTFLNPAPAPAPTTDTDRRLTAATTNWEETIKRCRQICESDIWCTVWQVYDSSITTTGNEAGCFTEQRGDLAYPLDRSVMEAAADGLIKEGAFIQHWYSEDITTTTTTTTAPPPPNRLLPILLGLAGLAALLGLGAYAMGWCSPKEKVKKRAKRALQPAPEPPKEQPKPEPVPTQPSFLMSAPVLTYQAAPVTYAAPMATMQAAPVTYAAPPIATASYQVVQPGATYAQPASSIVVPQEPVVGGFMG